MKFGIAGALLLFSLWLLWGEYWRFAAVLTLGEIMNSVVLVFVAVVVSLLLALLLPFHIIEHTERAVIYNLGKYRKTTLRWFEGVRGPGLFITIPFYQTIKEFVDIRDRKRDFIAAQFRTLDRAPIDIEGVYLFRVKPEMAELSVTEVEDLEGSVRGAVESAVKVAGGQMTLDQVDQDRDLIVAKVKESIEPLLERWGVKLIEEGVLITDVRLRSDELQESFANALQARIDGEGRIELAKKEKDIAEKMKLAAQIYRQDPLAYDLRKMGLLAEMVQRSGEGNFLALLPSSITDLFSQVGLLGDAAGQVSEPADTAQ